MNLVDSNAKPAQNALLTIAHEKPESTLTEVRHLTMPSHHEVREENVDLRRLGAVLAVAYDRDLRNFADLLLVENLGPRTLQTLAMVAEVVHGTPTRFRDPARYSFALGGKDGHPFPVPLKTYDETINVLRRSLEAAKMEGSEKMEGFRRLNQFVEGVENRRNPSVDFPSLLQHEKTISPSLGGRTVFEDRKRRIRGSEQLRLF
jgi:hypothetical protein